MWTADNSFLLEYRERCKCGDEVIGQDLMIELDNLYEDLITEKYEVSLL